MDPVALAVEIVNVLMDIVTKLVGPSQAQALISAEVQARANAEADAIAAGRQAAGV